MKVIQPSNLGMSPNKNIIMNMIESYISSWDEYNNECIWISDIANDSDDYWDEIEENVIRKANCRIGLKSGYKKNNLKSIYWYVLSILLFADIYKLTLTDLLHLKIFLQTPKGKELEGWAEWEAYWEKREAARAKKKK